MAEKKVVEPPSSCKSGNTLVSAAMYSATNHLILFLNAYVVVAAAQRVCYSADEARFCC